MINWINSKKILTTLFSVATIFSSINGYSQEKQDGLITSSNNQKEIVQTKENNNNSKKQSNIQTTKLEEKINSEINSTSPVRIKEAMKIYSPVDSARISSFYGRRHDHFHTGIDIAAYFHKEVFASQDGVVEFAGWKGGYGYRIVINHGTDDYGREIKTTYSHLSPRYEYVKKGDHVFTGDKISRIGKSGNIRGVHLHYEVIVDGKKVNPLRYMQTEKKKIRRSYVVVRHRPKSEIEKMPERNFAELNTNYELDLKFEERQIAESIDINSLSRKEKKEYLANMKVEFNNYILNIQNEENNYLADAETKTVEKYVLKEPPTKKEQETTVKKDDEKSKKYTIIVPKEQKEIQNKKNITKHKKTNYENLASTNETKQIKSYENKEINNDKLLSFDDFKKTYKNSISLESKLNISEEEVALLNKEEKEKLTNFIDSIFDLNTPITKTNESISKNNTQSEYEKKIIAQNKESEQLEQIIKNTIDSNYTASQNISRLSKGYEKGTYQYKVRLPSLEAYVDTLDKKTLTAEDKTNIADTLNQIQNNKYLANKLEKEEFTYLKETKDSIEQKLTAILEPENNYGIQINVYNNKVNKTKIQETIKRQYGIEVSIDKIKEDKVGSQYKYSFVNFKSKEETIAFIKEKRGSGMYGLIAYEDGTRKASWKKV